MPNYKKDLSQVETTCGLLLRELQIIWNEVGELDSDKDRMLLELEEECLEIYRRKVDVANRSRAQLRQEIADAEAELASICSAMGERPVHIRQINQSAGSLKEEFWKILPQLEEMKKRKTERIYQFLEVLKQIQKVEDEIYGSADHSSSQVVVDEVDLSLRKLEELHRQLHALQREKSDRLKQIQDHLDNLDSLCLVLGLDFKHTAGEIHPNLGDSESPRSISDSTIQLLATTVQKLRELKIQRMKRLQDLVITMLELWNLMDTPIEEQQLFQSVACNVAASEHEITEPNTLSLEFINHVEAEVTRLEEVKSSKMKELVYKKRSELDEICRKTHLVPKEHTAIEYAIEAVESGGVDPATVLDQIEFQITNAKEEAFSRKDILEKVEKWMAVCEEECWLEEYNRDENRYNAGRGTHLTLKRAEKARALVNKIPGMMETLASKTITWENERGIEFLYDGIRLLSMLEDYTILQQEKEQERRWMRDQKKLQGQLIAEQEVLYGSKPSPSKPQSAKKTPRAGDANNRRLSVGLANIQAPRPDLAPSTKGTPRSAKTNNRAHQNELLNPHQDDVFAGKRNHSVGTVYNRETELQTTRKPFSPIYKVNRNNSVEDQNVSHAERLQKTTQTNELPFCTPSKPNSVADEENSTPNAMAIPLLCTPATVSVPMQTAITPAPPTVDYGLHLVDEVAEAIEYSFEERRAGFVVPRNHKQSHNMIEV